MVTVVLLTAGTAALAGATRTAGMQKQLLSVFGKIL